MSTQQPEHELAEKLTSVEIDDEIKASFEINGDEKTTKQRVVDVDDSGPMTTIWCEECPEWNGPSTAFQVYTIDDEAQLKHELLRPMHSPIDVDRFSEIEVNPDE